MMKKENLVKLLSACITHKFTKPDNHWNTQGRNKERKTTKKYLDGTDKERQ